MQILHLVKQQNGMENENLICLFPQSSDITNEKEFLTAGYLAWPEKAEGT